MDLMNIKTSELNVVCPKHGTHKQYIESTIKGHEGHWCMICWLESLGKPLPTVELDGNSQVDGTWAQTH